MNGNPFVPVYVAVAAAVVGVALSAAGVEPWMGFAAGIIVAIGGPWAVVYASRQLRGAVEPEVDA